MGDGGVGGGEVPAPQECEQLSDMPQPLSDALGSCMELPARDSMPQLLGWLTFGLAELPEDLVGWVSVALAHGVLHLCEQLCEMV